MSVKLKLNQALINGSMEYWQRNTSFAAAANATYTADRWQYIKNTSNANLVHTISRSVDVPSSAFGVYSLLATPTAFQSSPLNAADYVAIQQKIEGNILRSFKGKKLVLSFWVKAYKAGTYCVAFRNADTTSTPSSTRSLVKEYTINASNTWEQKTIRITHDTSGTWAYDTGVGMTVSFTIAAGSTYQGSKDAWLNGSYLATSSQVNGVDSTSDLFYLSDVCLVEDNDGQTRTPDFTLAARDVFGELLLCQRYYEKSYNIDVNPGTITGVGRLAFHSTAAGTWYPTVFFKSIKRINPTMISYSDISGAINTFNSGGTATAYTSANFSASFGTQSGSGSVISSTPNVLYSLHFTAEAEL
jgi:hypothetical protein